MSLRTFTRACVCVLLASCSAGFFLSGCASEELARKDLQIAELSQRWERAERELGKAMARIAELRGALSEASQNEASLKEKFARTTQALKKSQVEQTRLAAQVKGLEEKNYDLEMAYGSVSDQIVSLRRELRRREQELNRAEAQVQQVHRKLKELTEAHATAVKKLKNEAAKSAREATRMGELLDGVRKELRQATETSERLRKEVGQVKRLKRQVASLLQQKREAEAERDELSRKYEVLQNRYQEVAAAAGRAGVVVPPASEGAGEWDMVKRAASARIRRLAGGSLRGDPLDWLLLGGSVCILLLLGLSIVSLVYAVRMRRRVQAEGFSGGSEEPACYPEEQGLEAPCAEDQQVTDQVPGESRAETPPAPACEPEEEKGAGEEEVPREPASMQPAGPEDERTEILTPAEIFASWEKSSSEEIPRAKPVKEDRAVTHAGGEEGPDEDENFLSDLRQVINKKFDELLQP